MTPHDRLRTRIARSSSRQVGAAALLLLLSVTLVDLVLVAGAAWIALEIMTRLQSLVRVAGILISLLLLCLALLAVWRTTRGYRNLRRLIDEARSDRGDRA